MVVSAAWVEPAAMSEIPGPDPGLGGGGTACLLARRAGADRTTAMPSVALQTI